MNSSLADLPATESFVIRSGAIAVELMSAGASVRSLHLPGIPRSLVLGAADTTLYGRGNKAYLGASVGRHANRIANGRFLLGDTENLLTINEPPHHLHGGTNGFSTRNWVLAERSDRHAVFTLPSPDGEEGYPGRIDVLARFTVEDEAGLCIEYEALVDRPTPVNLTAHLYFDLSGGGATQADVLTVDADAYLPVDEALIPTGIVASVTGTPFDFRSGRRLSDGPSMLDHNFCLAGGRTGDPRAVARLVSPEAGIAMSIETTEAGLQVYDGAQFDGSIEGLGGRPIRRHGAVALEPQGWPNAPNEPSFPSTLVTPDAPYRHCSVYRFERL